MILVLYDYVFYVHRFGKAENEVDSPAVIHFLSATALDIFSYDLFYGGVRLLAI